MKSDSHYGCFCTLRGLRTYVMSRRCALVRASHVSELGQLSRKYVLVMQPEPEASVLQRFSLQSSVYNPYMECLELILSI